MKKPYTIFGQTRNVPVRVYLDNKLIEGLHEWDEEYWVERGEDWYGLMSYQLKGKRVRVIERESWLGSELV
jgi:hypothetical protein